MGKFCILCFIKVDIVSISAFVKTLCQHNRTSVCCFEGCVVEVSATQICGGFPKIIICLEVFLGRARL